MSYRHNLTSLVTTRDKNATRLIRQRPQSQCTPVSVQLHQERNTSGSSVTKRLPPWNTLPILELMAINRSAGKLSPETLINTRLQLARNTRYSLMGAGHHGFNGISPAVAWSMYSTYVLPRLIFNMEVLILTQSQIVTGEVPPCHYTLYPGFAGEDLIRPCLPITWRTAC